jgi:hypothetical protein
MNNKKGLELASNGSFNFRHLGKECAEISYFDIDLKTNIMILYMDLAGGKWYKSCLRPSELLSIGRQWPPYWLHFSHRSND